MDDRPEDERLTVEPFNVEEMNLAAAQGRDIFAERVEARIMQLLTKYDCELMVREFHWMQGRCIGSIGVVRRAAPPPE